MNRSTRSGQSLVEAASPPHRSPSTRMYQRPFDFSQPWTQEEIQRGRDRRDQGMAAAADANREFLEIARRVARDVARLHQRAITIDDVKRALQGAGYNPADLGNAAGSVFKGDPRWMPCGYVKSTRSSRHRAPVMSWIYNEP